MMSIYLSSTYIRFQATCSTNIACLCTNSIVDGLSTCLSCAVSTSLSASAAQSVLDRTSLKCPVVKFNLTSLFCQSSALAAALLDILSSLEPLAVPQVAALQRVPAALALQVALQAPRAVLFPPSRVLELSPLPSLSLALAFCLLKMVNYFTSRTCFDDGCPHKGFFFQFN
jgi:hypothetical protein